MVKQQRIFVPLGQLALAALVAGMAWLAWDTQKTVDDLSAKSRVLQADVESLQRKNRVLDDELLGQKRYAKHLRDGVTQLRRELAAVGADLSTAREEIRRQGRERDDLFAEKLELSRRLERALIALSR